MIKTMTVAEANNALDNQNAVLIDVREQDEFDDVRITNAQHAPLSTLPVSIQKIDLDSLKDKKVIFQCLKGGRSAQAIEFLHDGYLKDYDLYNMQGGILEWIEHDLPVIKNKP